MSWAVGKAVERLRAGEIGQAYQYLDWGVREKFSERWYGIESTGFFYPQDLGTDPSVSHPYSPCCYPILDAVFRRIGPRSHIERQVFLDVGCGLGRAMVVAAAQPYAAVLGVEISADLAARSRENLARSRRRHRTLRVEVFAADAARFDVPDDVTTVFAYNPFHGAPMSAFMASLHASLVRAKRTVDFVFVNQTADFDPAAFPWLRAEHEMRCFDPASMNADGFERVDFYKASAA